MTGQPVPAWVTRVHEWDDLMPGRILAREAQVAGAECYIDQIQRPDGTLADVLTFHADAEHRDGLGPDPAATLRAIAAWLVASADAIEAADVGR